MTTDAWSNPNIISFLAVTAHYIIREAGTGRLLLRSGLLAFRHITGFPHRREPRRDSLRDHLRHGNLEPCKWHLPSSAEPQNNCSILKVGSITADNASNNNTMMEHLEERFRGAGVPFDRNGNRVRYL